MGEVYIYRKRKGEGRKERNERKERRKQEGKERRESGKEKRKEEGKTRKIDRWI